jgi:surface antigen
MHGLRTSILCIALSGLLTGCLARSVELGGVEQKLIDDAAQTSLERNRSGQSLNWAAPDGTSRGTVTPLRTYTTASGQPCRRYQQTLTVAGDTRVSEDTACRRADGRWISIHVDAAAGHQTFVSRAPVDHYRYDGHDAFLFGLLYGTTIAGIHHGPYRGHWGHHGYRRWPYRGHRYFRPGLSFGYGVQIGS